MQYRPTVHEIGGYWMFWVGGQENHWAGTSVSWINRKAILLYMLMLSGPFHPSNPPAGVSGSVLSPFCDALVPYPLHLPALLGLCPGCLGPHHPARYTHINTETHIHMHAHIFRWADTMHRHIKIHIETDTCSKFLVFCIVGNVYVSCFYLASVFGCNHCVLSTQCFILL